MTQVRINTQRRSPEEEGMVQGWPWVERAMNQEADVVVAVANDNNGTIPEGMPELDNPEHVEEEEVIMEDPEEVEKVMEEWTEATAEHDKELLDEFEVEQQEAATPQGEGGDSGGGDEIPPPVLGGDAGVDTVEQIEEELKQEELEAEMEDEAENLVLDQEGFIDGTAGMDTHDVDDEQAIIPEGIGATPEETPPEETPPEETPPEETPSPTPQMTVPPPPEPTPRPTLPVFPAPVDKTKVWTGEGVGNDDILVAPPPTPTSSGNAPSSPVPAPTSIATTMHPAIVATCSGLVCPIQTLYQDNPSTFLALLAFVPLFLLCCCRRFCRRSNARDARGDYRAVAARYGDMGYDNTFSDTMSDDGNDDEEDDDFFNGHGDVEDHSWGRSGGKRTLEMSKLGYERNGGLSLEEMNG